VMVGRLITSDKSVGQYFQFKTSNEITIAKISNCVLNLVTQIMIFWKMRSSATRWIYFNKEF
jgi:hypothetical protein